MKTFSELLNEASNPIVELEEISGDVQECSSQLLAADARFSKLKFKDKKFAKSISKAFDQAVDKLSNLDIMLEDATSG